MSKLTNTDGTVIAPAIAATTNQPDLAAMTILGVGTATPEASVTQDVAARMADALTGEANERRSRFLRKLYRLAGVEKRHCVLIDDSSTPGELAKHPFFLPPKSADDLGPSTAERMAVYETQAVNLATHAATRALANARVRPSEVTHLVTVSCTGFAAPGADVKMIKQLGLPDTAERTNIGFMGCHGAINGMRAARGITAADANAVVLLCAVELCTIHRQYGWDPRQSAANALFADGAAALIGMRSSPVPVSDIAEGAADGNRPWKVVGGGSTIVPDTEHLIRWRIGDHGFRMNLSREVPAVIEERLGDWLHPWLAKFGLSVADIGCWAAHPGGPRILEATAAGAGIDMQQLAASTDVLANYGNMSSPTVLFVLEKLRQQNASLPCVVLGFGPGLAIEAALIV